MNGTGANGADPFTAGGPSANDITASIDVSKTVAGASASLIKNANSINHEKDGQNALFGDGHLTFEDTPLCGIQGDNIFTSQSGPIEAALVNPSDSVLLPAN